MTVLVVGATGIVGESVCRLLRSRGESVRALVRPGSAKEATLRALGVEIIHGGFDSPDTIDTACHGAHAVISTATAMGTKRKGNSLRRVDHDGQLALVAAAARNQVGHFVFVSVPPRYTIRAPLQRYKLAVEAAIRRSGMRWTILQPSAFMEVWISDLLGWNFADGRALVFGSGESPISYISAHDVAAYCVQALSDPRLVDRDLPLGGPDAIAPNAVVKVFEAASGRPFTVRRVPRVIVASLWPVVALFDELAASGMSLGAYAANGDVIDSPVQREVALPLTSVRSYAERVLKAAG